MTPTTTTTATSRLPATAGPHPDPISWGHVAIEPPGDLDATIAHAVARVPTFGPIVDAVGGTPLIDVPGPRGGARIRAKLEWCNPAGSVKDRTAVALLARAFAAYDGSIDDLQVLEYSGGNLAAALGSARARLGFALHVVLSGGSPPSLLRRLDDWGCQVTLVDASRGFRAVIEEATQLQAASPATTYLYQHRNWVNVAAHETRTGAELVQQLGASRATAWVASVGTGGTLVGVARALRAAGHQPAVVAVTPAEMPYGTPLPPDPRPRYAGSGGLGDGILQPIVEAGAIGSIRHELITMDEARSGMRRFLDLTGMHMGSSAAANWIAARRTAAHLTPSDTVVTLFPCAGTPEEWAAIS